MVFPGRTANNTAFPVWPHSGPRSTRAGGRWQLADRLGLAAITGTVMRTGGSTTRNGDQLDRELDRLAARVEISVGDDSASASIFCLKEDIEKTLPILADLLQHPAFPQDKIELSKIEQRDSIARRNDDPQSIAFREYGRVIYGKDSPYGRMMENATVNAITREDLVAFHKQYFRPEAVVLGAWGDFSAPAMRAKIEQAFAGWERGPQWQWPAAPSVDARRNHARACSPSTRRTSTRARYSWATWARAWMTPITLR